MAEDKKSPWHSYTIERAAEALQTTVGKGLTPEAATSRLSQYGPNELAERPRPGFWQLLLGNSFQFETR